MLNDILADIWNNYRGRLLCSVFGLFVGVMVLWLGFFQALFLLLCCYSVVGCNIGTIIVLHFCYNIGAIFVTILLHRYCGDRRIYLLITVAILH